jgi:hypothetical protein
MLEKTAKIWADDSLTTHEKCEKVHEVLEQSEDEDDDDDGGVGVLVRNLGPKGPLRSFRDSIQPDRD